MILYWPPRKEKRISLTDIDISMGILLASVVVYLLKPAWRWL